MKAIGLRTCYAKSGTETGDQAVMDKVELGPEEYLELGDGRCRNQMQNTPFSAGAMAGLGRAPYLPRRRSNSARSYQYQPTRLLRAPRYSHTVRPCQGDTIKIRKASMHVTVVGLNDPESNASNGSVTVAIGPQLPVRAVLEQLGLNRRKAFLSYNGSELADTKWFGEYAISNGATLEVRRKVLRARYSVSGTDVWYGATRSGSARGVGGLLFSALSTYKSLSAYGSAALCPVLT
eukprot:3941277-Rhodomonas_salina.3